MSLDHQSHHMLINSKHLQISFRFLRFVSSLRILYIFFCRLIISRSIRYFQMHKKKTLSTFQRSFLFSWISSRAMWFCFSFARVRACQILDHFSWLSLYNQRYANESINSHSINEICAIFVFIVGSKKKISSADKIWSSQDVSCGINMKESETSRISKKQTKEKSARFVVLNFVVERKAPQQRFRSVSLHINEVVWCCCFFCSRSFS